jgi:hypothetical protein
MYVCVYSFFAFVFCCFNKKKVYLKHCKQIINKKLSIYIEFRSVRKIFFLLGISMLFHEESPGEIITGEIKSLNSKNNAIHNITEFNT